MTLTPRSTRLYKIQIVCTVGIQAKMLANVPSCNDQEFYQNILNKSESYKFL